MTTPNPLVAEIIANRVYGGRPTVRVVCPGCARTHLHLAPADAATPLAAPCGCVYTLGTANPGGKKGTQHHE